MGDMVGPAFMNKQQRIMLCFLPHRAFSLVCCKDQIPPLRVIIKADARLSLYWAYCQPGWVEVP